MTTVRSLSVLLMSIGLMPTIVFGQTIDFNRDIRPILSNRCLACHGPDNAKREAGLRLDDSGSATSRLESGNVAVVAGDPDSSELMARITSSDESVRMPPSDFGKPLTERETELIRRWIAQGAPFAKHWSYVTPVRPAVPDAPAEWSTWPITPIDHFAVHAMQEHSLHPSEAADARTLVRRVFLDLIGLPPSIEEANLWTTKLTTGGQGIDRQVWSELTDHLLARPEFGEHWARKWLDLARYADSSGYADDPVRTMWPWRDWVIRSINNGMPFDQFTIEQLAGDMLPNATEDQMIATGFHRNTMTNNEGGTQDEEFRNVAVVDRVNTTMAVWMGTTFNCAQCHNHKYDPLSQEEYFQIFAILNNTEDADRGDDSPRLTMFTAEQSKRREEIQQRLASLDQQIATPTDATNASQAAWEQRLQVRPEWTPFIPERAVRSGGGEIRVESDGAIFVPTSTEKDVYTLEGPIPSVAQSGTALRLETIPDPALPGGGTGHGGGNFVVTELRAQLVPMDGSAPKARYVRIEIPGSQKILSLAEVLVMSGGKNVARGATATQSTTDFQGPPELAIDGNTDGNYDKRSVTHTAISDDPWWEVDLGQLHAVDQIAIWNRTGGGIHTRLSNFRIRLLDGDRNELWSRNVAEPPDPSADFAPDSTRDVRLIAGAADFQQDGFSAEEVFDGKTEPENGWAVGGRSSEAHALILVPEQPIAIGDQMKLRILIEQNSPYSGHLLGRFRVSMTDHPSATERARVPGAVLAIADKPTAERTEAEQSELSTWYRNNMAPEFDDARAERAQLRQEYNAMKPDASVLVMKELEGTNRRKTLFQFRGNYLDKGPEVHEGIPAIFPQPPADQPLNRLTFARWLVSPDNPLTPRVVVNRYWEELFGRGIVATSEEFGSQGELPTHPELLDWMARELVDSGWNTKALLKLIVSSAVYQQSSRVTQELASADADNRWLARGPRVRLSSEMVRDQALAAAGLLSRKMYGPPVKPPQPNLGLSAAFGSSTDWQTSSGEDRYRRGIYTTWRRSNPYPSMATFDAPNREVCTLRRNRTNTPLQALVTLNDPVYVEAAQALARRILQQEGTTEQRIAFGIQCCLQRAPSPQEQEALSALYEDSVREFQADAASATKLATDPLGALPDGMNPENAAAMTVVASVMLNLDEMLLKR